MRSINGGQRAVTPLAVSSQPENYEKGANLAIPFDTLLPSHILALPVFPRELSVSQRARKYVH